MALSVAPTLVLAWGNPSRGDDALGPACLAQLEQRLLQRLQAGQGGDACPPLADVEFLEDFQLQVEHVCDLLHRQRVLFIDASASAQPPFEVQRPQPRPDHSVSSHALSPQALLHVMHTVHGPDAVPPVWVLGIAGQSFELGDNLSPQAQLNLDAAVEWAWGWVVQKESQNS
ncbi:hydrogenase maturation protease [Hydrogenophaga soli]